MLQADDLQALLLSFQLAGLTTFILLVIATPIAWWLSQTPSKAKAFVSIIITLPLILPPSVLGFYLLLAMGPQGFIGQLTSTLGLGLLPFSFAGLLVASIIYSLPFVVQPIYNSFCAIDRKQLEAAATLRASQRDTFIHVVLPHAKPGFIAAAVLGFAHTVGEFGVILMIGGNIPGVTKVASIQIYEHVESLNYFQAHQLAFCLVLLSVSVLTLCYRLQHSHNIVRPSS